MSFCLLSNIRMPQTDIAAKFCAEIDGFGWLLIANSAVVAARQTDC
jgi:hypothetical protein